MCCAALGGLLIVIAIVAPAMRGIQRSLLLGLGTRLQFLFFAVLVPVLVTEVIKWSVGRGRPFVGGEANVFHFSHFAGNPAYSSFPSGHATTAFALAFAVSAVWPQARVRDGRLCPRHRGDAAWCCWPIIRATSSPARWSAIIGAMFVRYWFAARRLGFAIQRDGTIVPLVGPSSGRLKRVARGAFAP